MSYGVACRMALLTVATAPFAAEAGMPALRGLLGETRDLADLTTRALSGEEAHHHGNVCDGKPDGWRCNDDYVLLCEGGRTSSHEECTFYQECKEGMANGSAVAYCEEHACKHKADGLHCKGDHVVNCASGRTVNTTMCAFHQECKWDFRPSAWCAEDACEDREDGLHCKDNQVVQCQNATTVNATKCGIAEECRSNALGLNMAACQEDDCHEKADGSYCQHDGVVQCEGGRLASFSKCPFFQKRGCRNTRSQPHAAACEEDACEDRADGWHCQSDHLVQCLGHQTVDVNMCPSFQECDDKGGAPACL